MSKNTKELTTVQETLAISSSTGWGDADFAARKLRRSLGVTPSAYRRLVCAPDTSDGA